MEVDDEEDVECGDGVTIVDGIDFEVGVDVGVDESDEDDGVADDDDDDEEAEEEEEGDGR